MYLQQTNNESHRAVPIPMVAPAHRDNTAALGSLANAATKLIADLPVLAWRRKAKPRWQNKAIQYFQLNLR
jgi:hypothetical protein